MIDAPYRFTIRKGTAPDTVDLLMIDAWSWTIVGTGTRQPDGSYAGTATVGDKGALHLPLVDGVRE